MVGEQNPTLVVAPRATDRAPVQTESLTAAGQSPAEWVVMGAHGGAGASTLAQWWPQAADTQGAWPGCPDTTQLVVLTARTCMPGLVAAATRLREWHAQLAPTGVVVVGLVLIPVRPGRIPAPVRRFREIIAPLVAGAVYSIGWYDELLALERRDLAPCEPNTGSEPRRRTDLTTAAPREVCRVAARITESIAELQTTGVLQSL
ncbi:hypothetical protein IU500_24615 [Nocardia terpenica]|uniref:hypothetical protein n=1 Tax=Nocardia terpenica TaxID=455432 RepID=UPI001895F06C|nr:hypothetical protein [Nocardia terpenica]MBF6064684.1 hypothetical protein [Nocardia terpenica]MBF6107200.1 hypothetical protein [Nocardia terpenica]MBF6114958.1 hypothetical protein [Nocardia terpenica]MBF6122063.1 hypothetical protein [Nocardia terpenica]MBF6154446.1 hypothetical protein [Nocardia terpenica]